MKPLRNKRRDDPDRRDFREGFYFNGEWWTCEQVHAVSKARMAAFDKLPKEHRDRINKEGR